MTVQRGGASQPKHYQAYRQKRESATVPCCRAADCSRQPRSARFSNLAPTIEMMASRRSSCFLLGQREIGLGAEHGAFVTSFLFFALRSDAQAFAPTHSMEQAWRPRPTLGGRTRTRNTREERCRELSHLRREIELLMSLSFATSEAVMRDVTAYHAGTMIALVVIGGRNLFD